MTQVTNTPYEALEVGQTASYSKTVGERDIQLFAASISAISNPVRKLDVPSVQRFFAALACCSASRANSHATAALISAPLNMPWAMRSLNMVAAANSGSRCCHRACSGGRGR